MSYSDCDNLGYDFELERSPDDETPCERLKREEEESWENYNGNCGY